MKKNNMKNDMKINNDKVIVEVVDIDEGGEVVV